MFKTLIIGLVMAFSSLAVANQSIEIVVPVAPGGAVDMSARGLSSALTRAGYENILVYKPGGNNEIARAYAKERRDNVIMVGSSATFVFSNIVLDRDNQYVQDFTIHGPSLTNSMAFYVSENSKYRSFKDLVNDARNNQVLCGVSNNHGEILLLLMNQAHGTNFKPVMYKGTGQMIPDVVGAHIPCAFDQTAPYMRLNERVRWLAVTGRTTKSNIGMVSDVLRGFHFDNWYAAAVSRTGNLAKDPKLMSILANWSQEADLAQPLIEQDFVPGRPEDLNARAQKETSIYRSVKR